MPARSGSSDIARRRSSAWADVTLTALRDRGGALRGFAKITHDMTERRAADEQIRTLNAELEQRVRQRTADTAAARCGRW